MIENSISYTIYFIQKSRLINPLSCVMPFDNKKNSKPKQPFVCANKKATLRFLRTHFSPRNNVLLHGFLSAQKHI